MRKISEIFVNGVCLEDILNSHKEWLNHEGKVGERADLSLVDLSYTNLSNIDLTYANLSSANLEGTDLSFSNLMYVDLTYANLSEVDLAYANLRYANLSEANLSEANLNETNLTRANLKYANLRYANLNEVNLTRANLKGANLSYTDLIYANLKGADLSEANLTKADLRSADLSNTNLNNANLNDIKYNISTTFLNLQCPEKGSFIGYKKANKKIVELEITEDAKRSSATTRKCRCSKAKVLSITNIENTIEYEEVASDHDKDFIYRVGGVVEVKDFDDNRWNECSTGIHFFMSRDEAVNY